MKKRRPTLKYKIAAIELVIISDTVRGLVGCTMYCLSATKKEEEKEKATDN